ncbi:hypothetical protein BY996DRAFT_6548406 [Phakopsora pachyrhizi]|nr:hypothetical protein BY996DRAFT_6548406 [Phakopsora pachyrhizi]
MTGLRIQMALEREGENGAIEAIRERVESIAEGYQPVKEPLVDGCGVNQALILVLSSRDGIVDPNDLLGDFE